MQRHHEALELRFVFHTWRRLDAAVHIDKARAALLQRIADVVRVQSAREEPEVLRVRRLMPRKIGPVPGLPRAPESVRAERIEQDELRDRQRSRSNVGTRRKFWGEPQSFFSDEA